MRWNNVLALAAFLLALTLAPLAMSAEPGVPMIKGSVIRDYLRITFQWPEPVLLQSDSSGKRITIRFDRAANPNFGNILSSLHPYVRKAELSDDKKTIILTTDKPYRTRTFVSGNTTGVDLLQIDKTASEKEADKPVEPEIAQAKEEPATKAKAEATKIIKPEPKKLIAVPEPKPKAEPSSKLVRVEPKPQPETAASVPPPKSRPEQVAEAKPEAAPAAKPAAKVVEVTPEETPTPEAKPEATKAEAPPETAPAETATPEKPVPPAPAPSTAASNAATTLSIPPSINEAGELVVKVEPTKNGFVLHFPWDKRVASAVFLHADTLWVVFSSQIKYNFDELKAYKQSYLELPESTNEGAYSILRFPVTEEFALRVDRKDFDWQIELANVPRHLKVSVPITTNTAPPLKPHLFLDVLEFTDPITTTDPAQGAQISITPFYQGGTGISPQRSFIEMTILASAQGLAVKKNTDDVRIALLRNGIKVTRPEGITLTPGLPQIEPEISVTGDETLFPYDKWKPSAPDKMQSELQQLRNQVALVPANDLSKIRLRIAQMYLAEGFSAEALGVLDLIKATDPEFFIKRKLHALTGAANFVMYRISDAASDFSAPELDGITEIEMWRNVSNILLGGAEKSFDYARNDKTYISKYPPSFRQKLAIIAADLSINDKNYNGALKIFDSLNHDKQMAPIQKYVDFMIATISSDTGQYQAAQSIWEKMARNDDRFMRARAEFSLVAMQLKRGKITAEEAIKRLDHLRIVWRGDNFELNLLSLLGQMYYEQKDYINALRTWREVVTVYPTLPDATDAAQKMAETFVYLFNQGGADNMQPFDALALYYEFPELMPIGKTGDQVKQNIASLLVKVDLLDRAAEMLAKLVQFRLEGEDKSRVGAQLALVQLLNHDPQKALESLQFTGYGDNSNELRLTRNHLSAQAFTELGRFNEALSALENDTTPDGLALKMNVYWNRKDWQNVISLGEQVLGSRTDITAPLTTEETEYLMKLALAYSFVGDTVQMQYLRDYFGPQVTDTARKDMFMFITRADTVLDNTNFASITNEINSVQGFLERYRKEVQDGNLGSVVQ